MRGFYRICSVTLLGLLPGLLQAQSACEDLRSGQRQRADELVDDEALHADAGSVDLQAYGVSTLRGGVRLRFGRQLLAADDVRYDQPARHLEVDGQTFFETDDIQVRAQAADLQLQNNEALFKDATYVAYAANARGKAGELEIAGSGSAALRDVRYTTCPEGQEDWVLEADEIRLDNQRGMGSAKHARLRFKGIPLFWLPRFYFPIGEQRQSGFLSPKLGESDNTGFDLSLPYYFNLAPNYDLTLTPRYMGSRGKQLKAEGRYLWTHSYGRSQVEYLDEDELSGEQRYLLATELLGGTGAHWLWQAGLIEVSDGNYINDLGSTEADEAQSHLSRFARLSYRHRERGLSVLLSAQNFQSLLDPAAPVNSNYSRLPELQIAWQPRHRNGAIQPQLELAAVNFRRANATEAWRSDAKLGLNWRYDQAQGFVASHIDYRYTGYQLREPDNSEASLERELPSLQTTLGLNFRRDGNAGRYQTLSPQVHYLYVPFRAQSDIPLFDTGAPDFSFDQLFAANRYTGADRIADANLLTTALRTDWYSQHGQSNVLSAKLGMQWSLERSVVGLPGEVPQDAGSSDWLGELDFQPSERLRLQLGGQWSASENKMRQGVAAARYQSRSDKFMQVSYRLRRGNFEQTDVLASWPLSAKWRVAGRWTYSLEDERSLEALGGVEYRSCCWAAQVSWRRHLNGDGDEFDSSLYLQLELNGLGKIGDGLDTLLQRDIL